eukprot:2581969-Lingulodinium_polyedra.AAC.1
MEPYKGLSGRVRQRRVRLRRTHHLANCMIMSLNALNLGKVGRQATGTAATGDAAPSLAVLAVQRRLLIEAATFDQARRGLGLSGD